MPASLTPLAPSLPQDYTLDYNYAAPFYGLMGSNHAAQAESYWRPITDWMPAARIKAQAQARIAGVSCPSSALYYACHLSPWGLMSLDPMTRYMSWNGHHALPLFLNHFEYTLNASFAEGVVLPLLDGLNQWWGCFLNKTATGPGPDEYVYADVRGDMENEGQKVPNPQIALSFISRTLRAQLDISAQLGLPVPALAAELAAHLPPWNTALANYSVAGGNFTRQSDTRCNNDLATWYNVTDEGACEDLCRNNPQCGVYSYCPVYGGGPPSGGCSGSGGEPKPLTCWGYPPSALPHCTHRVPADLGWMSGYRANATDGTALVWTSYAAASKDASNPFATYPMW